jgi:hypothetical protein
MRGAQNKLEANCQTDRVEAKQYTVHPFEHVLGLRLVLATTGQQRPKIVVRWGDRVETDSKGQLKLFWSRPIGPMKPLTIEGFAKQRT